MNEASVEGQQTLDELEESGRHYDVPYLLLERFHPQPTALLSVPEELARRLRLLPLFVTDGRLYVATTEPYDVESQDTLREATHQVIEPVLVTRRALDDALNRAYVGLDGLPDGLERASRESAASPEVRPANEPGGVLQDEDAPVIKLVNYILAQGVRLGASDIHLEPFEKRARLRYRVDGMLHEFPAPPQHLYKGIVSRLKILSGLDIAEKRLPQDGRLTFRVDQIDQDMRVSLLPNVYGEDVVLRLLNSTGMELPDLTRLGVPPTMLVELERLLALPHGLLLVTGPTGSGKSTTLYAALRHIYSPNEKILTLEDPVEARIDGVVQIQINADIGMTFASGLRAILRHDPDVIMLGEIRDLESAEIALRASLTGHLVLSTLHTNDAPLAVTRLIDMGVPPFLVLSSMTGVLAQRLIRRLCTACKAPDTLSAAQVEALELQGQHDVPIFRPVGCGACNRLGYRGRSGLFELLPITPAMRRLRPEELTSSQLLALAPAAYQSLRQSAVARLLAGEASFDDVVAITAFA